MKIKLKWDIPQCLRDMGLKPGDEFQDVEPIPMARKGTVMIKFIDGDDIVVASVQKEHYIRI